uniref:Nanos-type domain-containing protein n=1 Tax=Stegastes partitus TaxID=144197 RepID=A0A3B4ZBJ6_9TELE
TVLPPPLQQAIQSCRLKPPDIKTPQPELTSGQQSSAGVHQSHDLSSDNKRLTCSILRKYRRPICKATGDNAHTQKLCPENMQTPYRKIPVSSQGRKLAEMAKVLTFFT